jgi:hypothetical protein
LIDVSQHLIVETKYMWVAHDEMTQESFSQLFHGMEYKKTKNERDIAMCNNKSILCVQAPFLAHAFAF